MAYYPKATQAQRRDSNMVLTLLRTIPHVMIVKTRVRTDNEAMALEYRALVVDVVGGSMVIARYQPRARILRMAEPTREALSVPRIRRALTQLVNFDAHVDIRGRDELKAQLAQYHQSTAALTELGMSR